ncbi:MAG TPA: c-type cytochrome domain-containing protein [Arenibacter sp.]|nr:c-type cytochrome domain-containing protein [Arenibacter sp.]
MVKGDSPKWVGHAIFGLTVFLVFLLIFESFIDLPDLVTWLGRFHPVVLHFPIVLLLIAAVIGLSGNKVPGLLLGVATFSVLVTAITGFFLGTGPDPKGNLVFWHQWMGVGVAILAVVWYWIDINPLKQIYLVRTIQVMLIILVGLTGHYGGMLTHGEDFLDLPNSKKMGKIPDNPLIYEDIVHRVLDVNCIGCHNPNKKKGELLMTGIQELLVGGENGAAIVRGQPDNSELIKRLRLPPENEEHMPPEGKKPLSENEILILERWIALGASDTLRLNHLDNDEPLQGLVTMMMAPKKSGKWESFPLVADSTLQNLNGDYTTVKRISANSQALSVSIFSPPKYDPKLILALGRVADNIVELDLSGLPLGEKELEIIGICKNLEWLELDKTQITDSEFAKLGGLSNLLVLKAYATQITEASLPVLKNFNNLHSLYLWDTPLSDIENGALKDALPNARIDRGIDPELIIAFSEKDSIMEVKE